MKVLKYYISIICGLLTSTLLFADDITISAQLDTNQMRIGEQQNISLAIEYNSDKTLIIPDFGKELTHNIFLVDTFSFQSTEDKDKSIRKAKLPITCFDAGEYSFEIGPFIYGSDTIWSSPVQLSVQTVELDTTGVIKPIKPIRVPEYTFKDYLPKILTVVAIILVFALTLMAFTAKAQLYVGGSIQFAGAGNGSAFFGVSPEVGYGFNQKMAVGTSLGLLFGGGGGALTIDPYFRYHFIEFGPVV